MMELQRRQRIETAHRFQKHLEKVQEILQNALQNLPDPMEMDSTLLTHTESFESKDLAVQDVSSDSCHVLDRIMCNIIDNMQ